MFDVILNMLIESPEIIGELNGTFTPRAAEISEINVSESNAPPLSADPWESEPVPFNNAEWSGALLNEFESPEAESDRGGK